MHSHFSFVARHLKKTKNPQKKNKKWILIVVRFDWKEIHRQILKMVIEILKKYPIRRHLRRPEFQTELSTYLKCRPKLEFKPSENNNNNNNKKTVRWERHTCTWTKLCVLLFLVCCSKQKKIETRHFIGQRRPTKNQKVKIFFFFFFFFKFLRHCLTGTVDPYGPESHRRDQKKKKTILK